METYRDFIISRTDPVPPIPGWQKFKFQYVHKNYDGAPDSGDHRAGNAPTIDACKREIDELLDAASPTNEDSERM
jgi:hypothetical protein